MVHQILAVWMTITLCVLPLQTSDADPIITPQMPTPVTITVSQTGNSWAELIDDPAEVEELCQMVNSLSLVKTDETFDTLWSMRLYFGKEGESVYTFEIDKKGVVCLNYEEVYYRVVGYDALYDDLTKLLPKVF